MLRKCTKCKTTKHVDNFYKTNRKDRGFGYSSFCKPCFSIRAKKYENTSEIKTRWRNNNKDKVKANRKRAIENLEDTYIIENISSTFKIPYSLAKQYPDIIAFYRVKMKLKRLIKIKKDEYKLSD